MNKLIVDQLHQIFEPNSIAVIGASNVPFKWGAQVIQRLRLGKYKGTIYPINPIDNEVLGLTAFPSILDVPDPVDLAIITVRVDLVPNVMHECVRKKVKGAIIITADFAETGRDGQKLQQEVIDIARPGGVRVVGPNCMGLLNAAHDLNTFPELPPKGKIGFISQSGSICHFLIQIAKKKGYGLSKLISVGNQADLDVADFLEYLAADTQTQSIGMYLEGFQDGRKFFRVAREIAGTKPIVVYKAGRHPQSARVAMSHTAALTGEDKTFDALCKQVGFIRSENLFETLDMAAVLLQQPLPTGKNIGIQGTGGLCMVLADHCLSMGMNVPKLKKQDAHSIIHEIDFPKHAPPPNNPVDFAGSHTALMEATVINRLAHLDYIDGIISLKPVTMHSAPDNDESEKENQDEKVSELLSSISKEKKKPVVFIDAIGPDGNESSKREKQITETPNTDDIPCYQTPEEAVRAMATLIEYAEIRKKFMQ